MQLFDALRCSEKPVMAFVGAGGKTTAIFSLAKELIQKAKVGNISKTVLVTTTTHLGTWQGKFADHVIHENVLENGFIRADSLPEGIVLITGDEKGNRLVGVSEQTINLLFQIAERRNLPLLVEADGSKNRPMKAPAKHEPVIPEFVHDVVVVEGLSGLGKPLNEKWVHRPEVFSELSGIEFDKSITPEGLVNVLLNPEGGLKNIPTNARKVALLNQADDASLQSMGRIISEKIIPSYHSSIIANLSLTGKEASKSSNRENSIYGVIEPIAGIILAAGGSSRFGKPKQLLQWKNMPFIRHVVLAAQAARLNPIIVVIGAASDQVTQAISDLPVRIVINREWKNGISTSIRAGLLNMPFQVGGAFFLLADQPQISNTMINKIIECHQESMGSIVAPLIHGERGNPVLFDAVTFQELLSLQGDIGGRTLFSKYPVEWVPWHDSSQLIDVDQPQDYDKFLEQF